MSTLTSQHSKFILIWNFILLAIEKLKIVSKVILLSKVHATAFFSPKYERLFIKMCFLLKEDTILRLNN